MDSMNLTVEPPEPALASVFALTGHVVQPLSLSLEQLRRYDSMLAAPFDLRCFTTTAIFAALATIVASA